MDLDQGGIEISLEHWEQMRLDVEQHAPEEACGLVAGQQGRSVYVYPVENKLHNPKRFRMEPQAQVEALFDIEKKNLDLLAIYHSHPEGPPHPSPTDIAEASFPEAVYLIWYDRSAGWSCRAFRISIRQVSEIPIKLLH